MDDEVMAFRANNANVVFRWDGNTYLTISISRLLFFPWELIRGWRGIESLRVTADKRGTLVEFVFDEKFSAREAYEGLCDKYRKGFDN